MLAGLVETGGYRGQGEGRDSLKGELAKVIFAIAHPGERDVVSLKLRVMQSRLAPAEFPLVFEARRKTGQSGGTWESRARAAASEVAAACEQKRRIPLRKKVLHELRSQSV